MPKNNKDIDKNMLRERSDKLPTVTDEMYLQCSDHNREIVDNFFEDNPLFSPSTRKQYTSGLRQFLWFVHLKLKDKPFYEITKRDFNKYITYLTMHKMSSSGIKFKKSSVSTVCEYIEDMLSEEMEEYETFHNFTKIKTKIPKNQVYNKIAISEEEYKLLLDTLLEREDYLGCAWVACAFNSGARRGGIRQFKTEILDKPIEDGQMFVKTNIVREKGASIDGKQVSYMIPLPALHYIKLWIDNRGYDHEYIFTCKYGGEIKQVSLSWANNFCKDVLSPILNRRINPHLFKSSAISHYLSKGLTLKFVSKNIGQHNDVSTTLNFYDLRGSEDQSNQEFAKLNFASETQQD